MKKTLICFLLALTMAVPACAQNFNAVINDIIDSYMPWQSAEFSGKLKTDKLPVSPNVKIYMVRDSLLQISVRAPLLGEVGRLNLTHDEVLVVNKMKKIYCQEPAEKLFDIYPSFLPDIQSLLLARIMILGSGELGMENSMAVEVDDDGEGDWLVVPQTEPGAIPFNYGYMVGAGSRTKALVATVPGKGSLEIQYTYLNRGMQMQIALDRDKGKKFEAQLDFSSVRWGGSEMVPLKLGNYTKVSVKDFIGSLK